MNLANPEEGANNLGIFADLPSETTEAEPEQTGQTATSEETAEANNAGTETPSNEGDTETPSRRVKAKLDGREIEFDVVTEDVDLDLIPKGLMMEKSYRQKTMEHADNVREFEAKKSEFDSALAQLYDQIEYEAKQLESDEMKELKELDPDEFERKRLNVEKKVSLFKQHQEQRNQEILAQQQELARQEMAKLPEIIPEWMDDKVMQQDTQKISSMLKDTYGFNDQEIGSIVDSRVISIARKAALYDEIQAASLETNRKQKIPKSSKSNSTAQSTPVEEPSIESIFYGNN